MDREQIEKLAIDLEEKRRAWEALGAVNVFGLTPKQGVTFQNE